MLLVIEQALLGRSVTLKLILYPLANGSASSRPEVYMYGLRNPSRIAFDPGPDLIYIADVGENRREKLNVVSRTAAGTNLGWDVLEGTYCRSSDCTTVLDTTVLPVMEYAHDAGAAIIGGYVYAGQRAPLLNGRFIYADFEGFVRSLSVEGGMARDIQVPDSASLARLQAWIDALVG